MPNSSPIYLEVEDIFAIGAEQQSRRKSTSKETAGFNYANRAITSFMEAVSKMNEAVLVPSKLRDIEVRDCDANTLMPCKSDLYCFYQMLNTVKQDLVSSTNYHSAFMPAASTSNSGQNSGRVSPTMSLSRRASSVNIGMYGGNISPNGTLNGSFSNGNGNGNGASPKTLMPPTVVERRLSSPITSGEGGFSPEILASSLLLNATPDPYVKKAVSLSNLLAEVGLGQDDPSEDYTSEERVGQITSCFMHHLTALYTILGHFTKTANYITKRYHEETD